MICFINKKREEDNLEEVCFSIDPQKHLALKENYGFFELLMCYWFKVHKNKFITLIPDERSKQINDDITDLERFVDVMKIIK